MTTPKVYLNSIKAGVVTREILGDVCYSYNKRAKNYRDRESYYRNRHRNYHHTSDKYNNEENARDVCKGRTLTFDEIKHYLHIIYALTETDRIMKEIG